MYSTVLWDLTVPPFSFSSMENIYRWYPANMISDLILSFDSLDILKAYLSMRCQLQYLANLF